MVPVTVYLPGFSATKAPASSICATPPLPSMLHRTPSAPSALPEASVPVAEKRTTSPVRAVWVAGSIATRAIVPGITSSARVLVAAPALAVIVAVPGATAVKRPSGVMRTAFGVG